MRPKVYFFSNTDIRLLKLAVGLFVSIILVGLGLQSAGAIVEPDVGVPDIMVTPEVDLFLTAADKEMSKGEAAARSGRGCRRADPPSR